MLFILLAFAFAVKTGEKSEIWRISFPLKICDFVKIEALTDFGDMILGREGVVLAGVRPSGVTRARVFAVRGLFGVYILGETRVVKVDEDEVLGLMIILGFSGLFFSVSAGLTKGLRVLWFCDDFKLLLVEPGTNGE